MVPTCPICGERDADWLPYVHPWGKSWFCHGCDFVYSGTLDEAQHPEVKDQRERYRAMRDAQARNAAIGASLRVRGAENVPGRLRVVPNEENP